MYLILVMRSCMLVFINVSVLLLVMLGVMLTVTGSLFECDNQVLPFAWAEPLVVDSSTVVSLLRTYCVEVKMMAGLWVIRKDTDADKLVDPNRPGDVGKRKHIADVDNVVLQAAQEQSKKAKTQVTKRWHWTDVACIDRVVGNLVLQSITEHKMLVRGNLPESAKGQYGIQLPIVQTNGDYSMVWISRTLYQILCGLLVSDAGITKQPKTCRKFELGMGCSPLAVDLTLLIAALLEVNQLGYGMIAYKDIWNPKEQAIYHSHTATSMSSPVFSRLFASWYRDIDCGELFCGAKSGALVSKVMYPFNLVMLDALAFAMAFMGDGYVQNKNQLLIALLAYPMPSRYAFIDHMNLVMNISATTQLDHGKKRAMLPPRFKVYISPYDANSFTEQIFPYMPESAWYKFPSIFVPTPVTGSVLSGRELMEQVLLIWNDR